MRRNRTPAAIATGCLLAALGAAALPSQAHSATFTSIYNFQGSEGSYPIGDLSADAAGRIYGVTQMGGAFDYGVVFRLTPPAQGATVWTEEVLHSFDNTQGATPLGGVALDAAGNVYGTASASLTGAGIIYKLDSANGFALSVLHTFTRSRPAVDGEAPGSKLIFGPSGLLYGTTFVGGAGGHGTVFAISPAGDTVSYALIAQFPTLKTGRFPNYGTLFLTKKGDLIEALADQNQLQRNVFKHGGHVIRLHQVAPGQWTEKSLYDFEPAELLLSPVDGVVEDKNGNIFGCAQKGPTSNGGVFELTPAGGKKGAWQFTVIDSFGAGGNNDSPDAMPDCSVTADASGELWGTSIYGGDVGIGAVFRLDPPMDGQSGWTETVLHSFDGLSNDGRWPKGGLLQLGSAYYGGTSQSSGGFGLIYQITP